MLPNLSCLTNIYARLNQLHGKKVAGLTLHHDEQAQFDEILENSKEAVERLAEQDSVPELRHGDYAFTEQATLEFVTSTDDAGIQAADVIAGFTMRHVQAVLFGGVPDEAHRKAFQDLLALTDRARALGFNFVTMTRDSFILQRPVRDSTASGSL